MKRRAVPSAAPLKVLRRGRRVKRVVMVVFAALLLVVLVQLFWEGSRIATLLDDDTAPAFRQTMAQGSGLSTRKPAGTGSSAQEVRPTNALDEPEATERVNKGPFKEVDDLDRLPPRPGESFIPFETFLVCLAERLSLDLAGQRELPFPAETSNATTGPVTIPYLVQPVTIELADVKQFMCSLRAPIRHVTYVMNSNAPEMRVFLEALGTALSGWTSRVLIRSFPHNIGSAGAINVGLRHALTSFDYDTVPFVFVSEPNVRIPAPTMADFVPNIYDFTTYDKREIEKLEKEVAAEAAANAQLPQPLLLRTGAEGVSIADGQGLLSTSALLPQRIRNWSVERQMEAFTEFFALFYFNIDQAPGSHISFFVTRLAVLVGGYLDENYFPDYFDDPDIRWRYRQLGFASYRASFHQPATTFYDDMLLVFDIDADADDQDVAANDAPAAAAKGDNDLLRMPAASTRRRRKPPKLSREARSLRHQMKDAFGDGYSFAYAAWKWHVDTPVMFQDEFGPHPIYDLVNRQRPAGALRLPVDAWVLDRRRQQAIRRKLRKLPDVDRRELRFDVSLLTKTDFLRPL